MVGHRAAEISEKPAAVHPARLRDHGPRWLPNSGPRAFWVPPKSLLVDWIRPAKNFAEAKLPEHSPAARVLDDATPAPGLGAHCRYARPANTSTTAPSRYFHARLCGPSDPSRPLKARSRSHCTSCSRTGRCRLANFASRLDGLPHRVGTDEAHGRTGCKTCGPADSGAGRQNKGRCGIFRRGQNRGELFSPRALHQFPVGFLPAVCSRPVAVSREDC